MTTTVIVRRDGDTALGTRDACARPRQQRLVQRPGRGHVRRERLRLGRRRVHPRGELRRTGFRDRSGHRDMHGLRGQPRYRHARAPVRRDSALDRGQGGPTAGRERLVQPPGHRLLRRYGSDLGHRLVHRPGALQRTGHAEDVVLGRLPRQGREHEQACRTRPSVRHRASGADAREGRHRQQGSRAPVDSPRRRRRRTRSSGDRACAGRSRRRSTPGRS